jgi:hypothetical protein
MANAMASNSSNTKAADNFGLGTRLQEYRQHAEGKHHAPATHITGTLAELLQDLAEFWQLPDWEIRNVLGGRPLGFPKP